MALSPARSVSEKALVRHLSELPPSAVAYSGGVDSSLVAWALREAQGEEALALTVTGPAVAREEIQRAREVARHIGIRQVELFLDPLTDARYASNPWNRCYYCRSLEGDRIMENARRHGRSLVLDGLHRDDLRDLRPGRRAMDERGFRHPLLEMGWGKPEVRTVARTVGLPNWDTPANSCLASRFAPGEPITRETLARVEEAESYLHDLGFRLVRVRTRDGFARVEVDPQELPRLRDPSLWETARGRLRALGFRDALLDPQGYRPGGAQSAQATSRE